MQLLLMHDQVCNKLSPSAMHHALALPQQYTTPLAVNKQVSWQDIAPAAAALLHLLLGTLQS
jgi:hypothetical protein